MNVVWFSFLLNYLCAKVSKVNYLVLIALLYDICKPNAINLLTVVKLLKGFVSCLECKLDNLWC